jgi:hypothetical protein
MRNFDIMGVLRNNFLAICCHVRTQSPHSHWIFLGAGIHNKTILKKFSSCNASIILGRTIDSGTTLDNLSAMESAQGTLAIDN